MKKKNKAPRESIERRSKKLRGGRTAAAKAGRARSGGAAENRASSETFPKRTKKPEHVGLANEPRPGLGTRTDDGVSPPPNPARTRARRKAAATGGGQALRRAPGERKPAEPKKKPRATIHGYEEPRPEPREQPSDSYEHEAERSTGVSGHMGMA